MWQKIKNVLKRILPPPAKAFNREIERLLAAQQAQKAETDRRLDALQKALEQQSARMEQAQEQMTANGLAAQKHLTESGIAARKELQRDAEAILRQTLVQIEERLSAMQERLLLSKASAAGSVPKTQTHTLRSVITAEAWRGEGKPPAISVIVPVYKTEPYLRECLDSVINQTLADIEIICVDDGSPDNSAAILEEYRKKDTRITVISKDNGGLSSARNVGMEYARGEYLAFVDSDDTLAPAALEKAYTYAHKNGLDLLHFAADSVFDTEEMRCAHGKYATYYDISGDLSRPTTGPDLFWKLVECQQYRVAAWLFLTRRSHAQKHGLSFPVGYLHEDNLFTFQNLLSATSAARLNEKFYIRRVRADSIMTEAKRFDHVHGYLHCYAAMLAFLQENPVAEEAASSAEKILSNIEAAVIRTWNSLPKEEKTHAADLRSAEAHLFRQITGGNKE